MFDYNKNKLDFTSSVRLFSFNAVVTNVLIHVSWSSNRLWLLAYLFYFESGRDLLHRWNVSI